MTDTKVSCPECSTRYNPSSGLHCKPLSERQGPSVTSPNHPSNNGVWSDFLLHLNLPRKG